MFQNVRRIVSSKSEKQQIPWESTSLTNDFFFVNSTSNISTRQDITNNLNIPENSVSLRNERNESKSTNEANVTWKHDEKSFWLYLNDNAIDNRVVGSWSDKDLRRQI